MSSSSVTSASSKLVSCGIVVYDSIMLRAIVCRIRDIFSIRTPPKSSVSAAPGGVTPRGSVAATCSFVSRTWARTSSTVMRPPAPVGRTRRRSTPSCRASRRTAGPAAADAWPSPGTSSTSSSAGAAFLALAFVATGAAGSSSSSSGSGLLGFLGGAFGSASSSARRRPHQLLRCFLFFRLRLRFFGLGGAAWPFLLWAARTSSRPIFARPPTLRFP